jgi:hypothetical protein
VISSSLTNCAEFPHYMAQRIYREHGETPDECLPPIALRFVRKKKTDLTAFPALRSIIVSSSLAQRNAGIDRSLCIAAVESLAGDNAIDLCRYPGWSATNDVNAPHVSNIPVRIFWNASSTLLASRAEVSMNDRWFSPSKHWLTISVASVR